MTQQAFQLINPAGLYDPAPNAYSHVARLEAGARLRAPGEGSYNTDS